MKATVIYAKLDQTCRGVYDHDEKL
jgi:hypothetical protein